MKDLKAEMHKLYDFIKNNLDKIVTVGDIEKEINSGVLVYDKLRNHDISAMIKMDNRYATFKRKCSGRNITQYIFIDNRKKNKPIMKRYWRLRK